MPLAPGSRLGHYEVLAQIGAGGMGEVYRARDTRLNRPVAIKILPPAFAEDADRLRRFEQEAQAAGSLNHPNIVAVYDFGRQDSAVYVVTELLEGETLRTRLSGGAAPIRKAVEQAAQVARGLAAAHAKGITHRDIKPENLFVTNEGFVKILDFGLAKLAAPSPGDRTSAPTAALTTDPGVVMGTMGYMSPEQVRGAAIDHRSDIFSLGVVLYEMVAARRPFTGVSSIDTMSAILKEDAPELPETVPPGLDRIVRRCLEKSPGDRFESARDLAFALESVSSGSGREKSVKAATSRRKRLLWATAAVIAITLPAAGFWLGRNGARTSLPQFHRVTFRRGVVISALFSNDNKTIIYSAAWDGKPYELYSTQESSPESRSLGIKDAFPVSVSRAGEMALILGPILRWGETAGTLARAPVSGGAPREIAEGVFLADWSPDANELAVTRGTTTGQVMEYPIGRKLFENNGYIGGIKVSPKGDVVALIDSPWVSDAGGYLAIIGKDGKRKATSKKWLVLISLSWSPDGSEVWFTASDHLLSTQLYAMDLAGHVRLIAPLPGFFWVSDIAADGRVLLGQASLTNSLFAHASGSPQETDFYWHDFSTVMDLSPDGKQILFEEGGDATYNVTDLQAYVRRTDGSPAVRLGNGWPTALSPDGKWAMVVPHTQPAQLLALPLRAGDAHPLTADAIHHFAGRWLPDSKRVVFAGAETGHRARYYVQDSMQSPPRAISGENILFDRNADDIVLSPDGRWLAALMQDQSVQLLPVDSGQPRPVPGLDGLTPVAFCRDQSLLVYHSGAMPARILRVNLQTGKQTLWKELAPPRTALWGIQPIRVAPDCESYAYTAQYSPATVFVVSGLK